MREARKSYPRRRCEVNSGKGDAEKARYWQRTISEAARSGISIREFCRRHRLRESQFYWWQRKLKAGREERTVRRPRSNREG